MARRRMFTAELIESDRFADLPVNVQMLYVYMGVNADDEGFVSAPKRMARFYDCPEGLDILEKQGFIIRFDSGVVAIVDWYLNNTIRKDRSMVTVHQTERQQLTIVNGRYVLQETTCQPVANQVTTQNRIEENRVEENRIEKNRLGQDRVGQCACGAVGAPQAAEPHWQDEDCWKQDIKIPPF